MPKPLEEGRFVFYFYSNEGNEPCHTHVRKGDGVGKIWLEPDLATVYFEGFSSKEIKRINQIVFDNFELLKRKWYEHFSK
jgi:hypothetical protein